MNTRYNYSNDSSSDSDSSSYSSSDSSSYQNNSKTSLSIDQKNFDHLEQQRYKHETVIQVCSCNHFCILLTKDGHVYTTGANYTGQRGVGKGFTSNEPVLIDPMFFNNQKIVEISANMDHVFALSNMGRVYAWGNGYYGILGLNSDENIYTPQEIDPKHFGYKPVTSIEAGRTYSFFIVDYRDLYICGSYQRKKSFDKLEYDDVSDYSEDHPIACSVPILIQSPNYMNEMLIKVCSDRVHLILTSSGNIYQLSTLTSTHIYNKTKEIDCESIRIQNDLIVNEHIKKIDTCQRQSIAVSRSGKLFTWNDNTQNQNLPELYDIYQINSEFIGDAKVVDVSLGDNHLFVVTDKGNIFAHGDNSKGQLGFGTITNEVKLSMIDPSKFDNEKVVSVDSFFSSDFTHTMAVTQSGSVYVWGNNNGNVLGLGEEFEYVYNINEPIRCQSELFGSLSRVNKKMYINQAFEDIEFDFDY